VITVSLDFQVRSRVDIFLSFQIHGPVADRQLSGRDPEAVTPEQTTETVKEIINMIAGNTFGIFDEKAIFNLGIPQFVDFKKIKSLNPGPDKQILVVVDTLDQTMVFQLILNA